MSLLRQSSSVLLLSLLGLVVPVNASETNSLEITPLIGYRFGGDFEAYDEASTTLSTIKLTEDVSYGVLFAWDFDRKRQGELLITHNNTQFSQAVDPFVSNNNLSVTYVHIGGNVPISDGSVPFYLTGGLGLTHLSPEDSQLANETRFSMNVGLMAKIPLSENLSFLFSGRVYATFFNSNSKIFCNEAICAISVSSDLWIQSEVNAGLTFSF